MTAEIMKTCTLTCQPGSIVEITVTQFLALGDAARELPDDAEITLLENAEAPKVPEIVEKSVENAENATDAPEIPEAEAEPDASETTEAEAATDASETTEKKPKRRKKE